MATRCNNHCFTIFKPNFRSVIVPGVFLFEARLAAMNQLTSIKLINIPTDNYYAGTKNKFYPGSIFFRLSFGRSKIELTFITDQK